jgi:hypothetical protein
MGCCEIISHKVFSPFSLCSPWQKSEQVKRQVHTENYLLLLLGVQEQRLVKNYAEGNRSHFSPNFPPLKGKTVYIVPTRSRWEEMRVTICPAALPTITMRPLRVGSLLLIVGTSLLPVGGAVHRPLPLVV